MEKGFNIQMKVAVHDKLMQRARLFDVKQGQFIENLLASLELRLKTTKSTLHIDPNDKLLDRFLISQILKDSSISDSTLTSIRKEVLRTDQLTEKKEEEWIPNINLANDSENTNKYLKNFKNLMTIWKNPDLPSNPNTFTKKRQKMLYEIIKSYSGDIIPYTHFSDELCSPPYKLRNSLAFPVVYGYLCGVLERTERGLRLKKDIRLGESSIPRNGYIPPEIK